MEIGPRRRLGAEARRESILAVALPEFAASGYERTRVADIAAKVGVTEPVIFQNFGTKADLFAAVLERASDQLADHLAGLARERPGISDLLAGLLAPEHQDRMHSRGGLGVIFAEAAETREPRIGKAWLVAHKRVVEAIAHLLRRGQAEGSIRDDVDAVTLAWLVLSQIHARQFRRTRARSSPALEGDLLKAVLLTVAPRRTRGGGQ